MSSCPPTKDPKLDKCTDLPEGQCDGNQPAFPEPPKEDSCGPQTFETSVGVDVQCAVDEARREGFHLTGLRPYRVFLVWRRRRRDTDGDHDVILRKELVPVNVVAIDGTDLELTVVGLDAIGPLTLTQISPGQVSDDELRGKLEVSPGVIRNLDPTEEEFFYEIQHEPFPGQSTPLRRRYILAAEPHHDAIGFQYVVTLRTQETQMGTNDEDQNLPPQNVPRRRVELIS